MKPAPAIRRLGLEVSLKPFASFEQDDVTATCTEIFRQWQVLASEADELGVMLWIADGSEILDWDFDEERSLDWGSSIGFENTEWDPYGPHHVGKGRGAHPYREHVPTLTYAGIRRVVATLKDVGERMIGVPVTVGATFDPGPEFARSEFKYVRHRELVADSQEYGLGAMIAMLRVDRSLAADPRPYAAYPDGIPEGTSFGTFLGAQAQSYMDAMGIDYLWLSNGVGFSSFPWSSAGVGFDGNTFHPERLAASREAMRSFWHDLLAASTFPIEVRGTNFTAGMDIGSDGTPASEILAEGRVRNPPPNSPWGALNEDFAVELTGYMSRIAQLPRDGFLFRFYVNDPWFWQNPWWDFYHRDPFDIFLPLSVARIDGEGSASAAKDIQILSIDTAAGVLDERVGREVAPYILQARESSPDATGPFVWLYPFSEYHDDAIADGATGASAYFEDELLTGAVREGLPLNSVLNLSDLDGALAAGALRGRVVIAPTRALRGGVAERLRSAGAHVIAYGAAERADDAFLSELGITLEAPLAGDLTLGGDLATGRGVLHPAERSGGGVREVAGAGATELARVAGAAGERSYAVAAAPHPETGTHLLWVRGSASTQGYGGEVRGRRTVIPLDRAVSTAPGEVFVSLLRLVGYTIISEKDDVTQLAIVQSVHRNDGAWWFNGYLPDSTVRARWAFPHGVPLLHQRDCEIEDGVGTYSFERSYHRECRLFVKQREGRVSVRESAPFPFGTQRFFRVHGLQDAELTIFPPRSHLGRVDLELAGETVQGRVDDVAGTVTVTGVTGTLRVLW